MTDLTTPQQLFVDELVASGCTPTEAARRAGYSHPGQEAYRLMRNKFVMASIQEQRNRLVAGFGCNIAFKTFIEIMQDTKASASARVSAARAMFEAGGHFANKGDDTARDKPLAEMTQAELASFIARTEAAVAAGAGAPLIRVIDQPH